MADPRTPAAAKPPWAPAPGGASLPGPGELPLSMWPTAQQDARTQRRGRRR